MYYPNNFYISHVTSHELETPVNEFQYFLVEEFFENFPPERFDHWKLFIDIIYACKSLTDSIQKSYGPHHQREQRHISLI